jgi:beta-1,2-mannosidase
MMTFCNWGFSLCLLHVLSLATIAAEPPPLVEKDRPDWEIKFSDAGNSVISVMPGESKKTFRDPITKRGVKWEQDVYCPTFTVIDRRLFCVYRAFGDDDVWRLGLAWSDDGLHFTRSDKPVLVAQPEDAFLDVLGDAKQKGVSYGDPHVVADRDGNFYLYFNFLYFGNTTNDQQLAVATSRDMRDWKARGRIFAAEAPRDKAVIPERAPWRLPVATVVSRLEGDRFVATKIGGKYWMYFNCYATKGPYCICAATSDDLLDWKVVRDAQGKLVNPLPARPGRFDSAYTDPVAAVLRDDGILLIYNGVNAEPTAGGDPRLKYYAHHPAQALFDRNQPGRLLKRSTSPFKGGDAELEKQPVVFWVAPVYEAWSLVPFQGELLLYWNHNFGRRSVGLWKAAIPPSMMGGLQSPP